MVSSKLVVLSLMLEFLESFESVKCLLGKASIVFVNKSLIFMMIAF